MQYSSPPPISFANRRPPGSNFKLMRFGVCLLYFAVSGLEFQGNPSGPPGIDSSTQKPSIGTRNSQPMRGKTSCSVEKLRPKLDEFVQLRAQFRQNVFPYILIISRTKVAGRFKLGTHLCLASSYCFVRFEVFVCSVTGVTSSSSFAPTMDTTHQELLGSRGGPLRFASFHLPSSSVCT